MPTPLNAIPIPESSEASAEADDASASRAWLILGTESESAAIAKAATVAPAAVPVGAGAAIAYLSGWSAKLIGRNAMEVAAKYKPADSEDNKPPPAPGEWEFRGSPVSRMVKVTRVEEATPEAWGVDSPSGLSGSPPDFHGVIGWDGKKINGVDWPVGSSTFTVRQYFHPWALTTNLLVQFNEKIGYVNDDDFLTFQAGELRFMGAEIDQQIPLVGSWPTKPASATFTFDVSPNGDVTVPGITWAPGGADSKFKKGWHYLDVYYEKSVHADGMIVPRPKAARILKIGKETSFADLFGWNDDNRRGHGVEPPP